MVLFRALVIATLLLIPMAASGQPRAIRPEPGFVQTGADTLRGIKEMAVEIEINGIRDIPESTYLADIENRLRSAGIRIVPHTANPHTYPFLLLTVQASVMRSESDVRMGSVAVYTLQFWQLIPPTRRDTVKALTWLDYGNLWGDSMELPSG